MSAWTANILAVTFLTVLFQGDGDNLRSSEDSEGWVKVRAEILRKQDCIRSMHVVYSAMSGDRRVPAGAYVRRELRTMAPCYFFVDTAHGFDGFPWNDDPFRQRAYVGLNEAATSYPPHRAFFRKPLRATEGLPGSLPGELFMLATGVWPMSGRSAPRPYGGPHMLRDVAMSDLYCLRTESATLIGDTECHLLERPGNDRIWLSVDHKECVVAREIYDPHSSAIVVRFDLGEFFDVDGYRFPGTISATWYDSDASQEALRHRVVRETTLRVEHVSINKCCLDDFRFVPDSGSIELGLSLSDVPVQVTPGGVEHLDSIVEFMKRHGYDPGAGTMEKERKRRTAARLYSICIGSLCGVLVFLAIRWRARRAQSLLAGIQRTKG